MAADAISAGRARPGSASDLRLAQMPSDMHALGGLQWYRPTQTATTFTRVLGMKQASFLNPGHQAMGPLLEVHFTIHPSTDPTTAGWT